MMRGGNKMKNINTIFISVIFLLLSACEKHSEDRYGKISFELLGDESVAEATRALVSDFTALPSKEDFQLTITGENSAVEWSGMFSEWDPETIILEGQYTATVSCGDLSEEGFDAPYFLGSEDFAVVGGETVSVKVTAGLNNTMMTLSTTDWFRRYYSDYAFSLTRDGVELVAFEKDDTRAAFVDGYKVTLEGTLKSETNRYTLKKEFTSLAAGTVYRISVDIDNVGSNSIVVKFNDEVAEIIDLGDLELNEE